MAIKKAEDNNGIIIRFRELFGKKCSAEIQFNMGRINKVSRTYITEEYISDMECSNNKILLSFEPFGLETIRIVLNNENWS